jgi:hypothetical protein
MYCGIFFFKFIIKLKDSENWVIDVAQNMVKIERKEVVTHIASKIKVCQ